MKFDVVVGNPPYQENYKSTRDDGSANPNARPLYPAFVIEATMVSHVQSIIIPARWLSGSGRGLNKFSNNMITSKNFRSFAYYLDSQVIFPDNDIKGGICFFIRDSDYVGKANVTVVNDKKEIDSLRYLDENDEGVFIVYPELSTILNKVQKSSDLKNDNIATITSAMKPYGLSTNFFKKPTKGKINALQNESQNVDDIEIFGLEGRERTSKFVQNDYPLKKSGDIIASHKVFLPKAYGAGCLGETVIAELGGPLQICTETYLQLGNFETRTESERLYRYVKSKFFRALVGILKNTQDATRKVYRLVPLQDFTASSDIDWSQSIADIDQQLYKKYGLNEEEITFIETHVKEME